MKLKSSRLHAFTLVELLVVITIIAVLAGIAMPVYSKVQERAKALQDGNNLRQLGVGTIAFASDNDGDLLYRDGAGADTNWATLLRENYSKDNNTFHSPFDKRAKKSGLTDMSAPLSYGANPDVISSGNPRNLDDAQYPSQLIVFAPIMTTPMVFDGTFSSLKDATKTTNGTGANGGTHGSNRRIKVVMLDGHVEDLEMMKYHSSTGTEAKNRWEFQAPTTP
jgi:prepilin-type N-terminal cleavage/methylation domain-containing protein